MTRCNQQNLLDNLEQLVRTVTKLRVQIGELGSMSFTVKKSGPLQTIHDLVLKFQESDSQIATARGGASDLGVGAIVEELNQISHTEQDQGILVLKTV